MPETAPWGVTLWQLNGPESTFMLYMKHVGNIKVYCNHKVSLVEITEYMEGLAKSRLYQLLKPQLFSSFCLVVRVIKLDQ